jgi:hypothetical protein
MYRGFGDAEWGLAGTVNERIELMSELGIALDGASQTVSKVTLFPADTGERPVPVPANIVNE